MVHVSNKLIKHSQIKHKLIIKQTLKHST